jgi:lysophospholipase L1-like esterase
VKLNARTLLPNLAVMVMSFAIAEGLLQAISRVSPSARRILVGDIPAAVPDAMLRWRGNPEYVDHDSAGYRNASRPPRASVVVFGDSMTYGTWVQRDEAWPQLLAADLGQRVYNMAFPGFCPAHSLLQLDDALSLKPRAIVVAVYMGNDFYDGFTLSRANDRIRRLAPADLVQASAAKDAEGDLEDAVEVLFLGEEAEQGAARLAARARMWLSVNSRLYGLARAVKHLVRPGDRVSKYAPRDFASAAALLTPSQRRDSVLVDQHGWRAILPVRYHAVGVDDNDVRIRQGVEVVKRSLNAIADATRAAGVSLLVVIIPTKETGFWTHADQPTSRWSQVVANEQRLKAELMRDLAEHRIAVVDVTKDLQDAPGQPYFENSDSHPNALGHRVIMQAVARALSQRGIAFEGAR